MQHYLIAYDIAHAKRRRKVAKLVYAVALGGQKSALESILDEHQVDDLAENLHVKMKNDVDSVHLVKVAPNAILLGCAVGLEYDEGAIII